MCWVCIIYNVKGIVVDTRRTTYRISYTEYFSYLHEVECEILHLQALILARISEKVADP